ncbi:hypothetical protein [Desulfosporosinus sp. SB140]
MMRSQEKPMLFEDQKSPEKMCVQIQKEEEQHGEDLINYLYSKGAYPIQ